MKWYVLVRLLGKLLLGLAFLVIAIGLLTILFTQGFGALQETLSPFNIANYLLTMITLAPGYLLLMWSEKLEAKYVMDKGES